LTTCVASLRAINVGGDTVKAAELRAHFETLGLGGAQTYLNSGNVSFESNRPEADLESAIEMHLASVLTQTFSQTPGWIMSSA
jgi:uncharacterized protein (DUF1697 family)